MLQQLLQRLVFDVPLLNEYCKMPLKVNISITVNDTDYVMAFFAFPSQFLKAMFFSPLHRPSAQFPRFSFFEFKTGGHLLVIVVVMLYKLVIVRRLETSIPIQGLNLYWN